MKIFVCEKSQHKSLFHAKKVFKLPFYHSKQHFYIFQFQVNLLTINLLVWMSISTTICQYRLINLKHKWAKDLPHTKKKLWFQSKTCHTNRGTTRLSPIDDFSRMKSTLFLTTVVNKEIKLFWESPIQFTTLLRILVTMKTQQKHSQEFIEELYTPLKMLSTHQQSTMQDLMPDISYSVTAINYCNIIWWEIQIYLPPFHWSFS